MFWPRFGEKMLRKKALPRTKDRHFTAEMSCWILPA